MSEPLLWPLGDHTPGKHLVLQEYLKAWYPILGTTQKRILFIDGFCGPGEYAAGEPGSPIIALRALREHAAASKISAEVWFYFVDNDERRIRHLRGLVEEAWPARPVNVRVEYAVGRFDETITTVLDDVASVGKQLAPTFLMVDPFGISDTPMSVIERFLRNDKCEVYISFMWEYVNRFKGTPEFEPHLDAMFGALEWRDGIDIAETEARKAFLFDLYKRQLRKAGAKFVLHFELYQGERLKYAIFFGSKSAKACDKMKQAIWKVDPFGGFAFRGARGNQLHLRIGGPDFDRLARELMEQFEAAGWLTVEQISAFCESDRSDFHSSHYKEALRRLETDGKVEVDPTSRKRSKTFPAGTRLRLARNGYAS